MARYHNISGELTQELIAPGSKTNVSTISLTNVQKVSKCKVDLYVDKLNLGKFYILKSVELPIGATLVHDLMGFNSRLNQFGLYIKLTDGATFTMTGSIDVTGTNTNVPGTNTLYTSELSVGDEIVVSGETRTIATITGDTTATVTAAWGSDLANDATPDCNPTALVDVILR
tara:strand:- start:1347 stop:1862 length:516 start_codon:yes stop_codon:yes gene_type:complete